MVCMVCLFVFVTVIIVFHQEHMGKRTGECEAEECRISGVFPRDKPEGDSDNGKRTESRDEPFFHSGFTSQENVRAGISAISESVNVTLVASVETEEEKESVPVRWCPPGGEPSHIG